MKGIQTRDRLTPTQTPSVPRFESLVNEDPPENLDCEHWVYEIVTGVSFRMLFPFFPSGPSQPLMVTHLVWFNMFGTE